MKGDRYIKVMILKAPGHLWYSDHIGQIITVIRPLYYNQDYYHIKGHKNKIIFKEDCQDRH